VCRSECALGVVVVAMRSLYCSTSPSHPSLDLSVYVHPNVETLCVPVCCGVCTMRAPQASSEELTELHGIGPRRAQLILQTRSVAKGAAP